jgi:anaerobic dimethyl sulfoxide reductase subunit C (anchor subunit)
MNVREWALVAFTILAQMSVGSFLVLGVVHFFAARAKGEKPADELSDRALLAIFPVLALGLLASLAHLGNPLNAYRAVTNVGTSWLSREILCGVLFAVTGALFALMQWRKLSSPAVRNIVAWVAAAIGLVLVYSMAQVYMIPARPTLDLVTTPLAFYTTTLLLGVLAVGGAYVATYAHDRRTNPKVAQEIVDLMRPTIQKLSIAAIVLVGIEFVLVPLNVTMLAANPVTAPSAGMLMSAYGGLFIARLALVFVGAGVLGLFLYQVVQKQGQERMVASLSHTAFLLVFIGEVLGRILFYATSVKIGLQ